MPILVIATLAIQIVCAVHVVRTGRQLYWIWIIAVLPGIGCFVYFITQILPDLRNDPRSRKMAQQVLHTIDPERQRRHIRQQLEISNTVDNRRKLAEECLRLGDYTNAIDLFRSCLQGIYTNDPQFMLGLAHAQAGTGDFQGARETLEELIKINPEFRSSDGHLLYVRTLEELGDTSSALVEYQALSTSYPGEEARYRYGALLKKHERFREARDVFISMLNRAKLAPRYYRRKEKPWLSAAEKELRELGQSKRISDRV